MRNISKQRSIDVSHLYRTEPLAASGIVTVARAWDDLQRADMFTEA
jgi:hypothetical protein